MNLIDRIAKLREAEAKATRGEWLPGDLETGCIAGDGGHRNVVLRRTNGGSIPSQENIDLICGLRNAAPEMLSILSEIRPGDEDHIYNVISLANMCNNGSLSEPPEFDEDDLDCLRRYAVIAERMEAESK